MLEAWLAGVSVDLGWGGPEEVGEDEGEGAFEAGEWSSSECAAAAAGPGECDALLLPGGIDVARGCPHASLSVSAAATADAALDATLEAPPALPPPHYCPADEGEEQPEEAWGHRGASSNRSAAALLAEPCAALQYRGGSVWESWPQQPLPRDAGGPPPSALGIRASAATEERQPMRRLPAHHVLLYRQGLGSQCGSSASCDGRGRSASASARCGGGFLRQPDEATMAVVHMGRSGGWGIGGGGREEEGEGIAWLLRETDGWSGADLRALAADAAMAPVWEAVPRLLLAAAAAAAAAAGTVTAAAASGAVAAQGTSAAPATVTGCSPCSGARGAVRRASEGEAEEGEGGPRPASYCLCPGGSKMKAEEGEAMGASLRPHPGLLAPRSPRWPAEGTGTATPRSNTLTAGGAIVPGSESYQSPGDRECLPSQSPDDAALDLLRGGEASAGISGEEAPAVANAEPLDHDPPALQVRAVSRADFHAALLRVRPALSFGLSASADTGAGMRDPLAQAGDGLRHAAAHFRRDTGSAESDRGR